MGSPLPSGNSVVAQRLGGIHPVPGLQHRDKKGDLFDQPDRIDERPLSACRAGPRSFPHRAGRHEMPILGHPVAGPDRDRPEAMGHALEASVERLRDHLRRPHAGKRNHLTEDAAYTINLTDPPLPTTGLVAWNGESVRCFDYAANLDVD